MSGRVRSWCDTPEKGRAFSISPGSAWWLPCGSRDMSEAVVRWWAFLSVQVEELHVFGHACQCEHVIDLARAACHDQSATGAAGLDAGVDDDERAGGVHEGQCAHVEHDQVREDLGLVERPLESWTD